MRPVGIGFSAAADGRAYRVDRNTVLSWVITPTSTIISTDPSATIANRTTTPADRVFTDVIMRTAAGAFNANMLGGVVGFQLSLDEIIYISAAAAGLVLIFFDDPAE